MLLPPSSLGTGRARRRSTYRLADYSWLNQMPPRVLIAKIIDMPILSAGTSDPELEKLVSEGLDEFNAAALASDDETPLSIRATADNGTLIGGITGFTWAAAAASCPSGCPRSIGARASAANCWPQSKARFADAAATGSS